MNTMLFKQSTIEIKKNWKIALLGLSLLLISCATSQPTSDATSPTEAVRPVPIYNPVIPTQPGISYVDPTQDSASGYSPPKASKKAKKKPKAKKSKPVKQKVTKKSKNKKNKKSGKRTRSYSTSVKSGSMSVKSPGYSKESLKVAGNSSPVDSMSVMGEYRLGDTLSLETTPTSQGVSIKIQGTRPGGQPCDFKGEGKLNNGTTTITDQNNNVLNLSFSGNSVSVQGDTLGESCGGEYQKK